MSTPVKGSTTYVTYVLRLEEDRWYVGRTTQLQNRLTAHWTGNGAKWTKVYSPIEVQELYAGDREQELTEQYVLQYGHRYVRGGDYCTEKDLKPKAVKRLVGRIRQRAGLDPLSSEQVAELFTSGELVTQGTARARKKRRNPRHSKPKQRSR